MQFPWVLTVLHLYVTLYTIYPPELEIKETTETFFSQFITLWLMGSFLPSCLRSVTTFRIGNSTCIFSNIPESTAYDVYISQLIRYTRSFYSCGDFIGRGRILTKQFVDRGYKLEQLKIYFRMFYGRYNDLLQYSPFTVYV